MQLICGARTRCVVFSRWVNNGALALFSEQCLRAVRVDPRRMSPRRLGTSALCALSGWTPSRSPVPGDMHSECAMHAPQTAPRMPGKGRLPLQQSSS